LYLEVEHWEHFPIKTENETRVFAVITVNIVLEVLSRVLSLQTEIKRGKRLKIELLQFVGRRELQSQKMA
jgi:hypothetical protein